MLAGMHSLPEVRRRPIRNDSASTGGNVSARSPSPRMQAANTPESKPSTGITTVSSGRMSNTFIAVCCLAARSLGAFFSAPSASLSPATQCRNASTRVLVPASPA